MKILVQSPSQTFSTRYAREPMIRRDINRFKEALTTLFERITEGETEEHYKNLVADFLKTAFYTPEYEVNTKGRQDLAIHTGKQASYPVGVIIEAKRPENKAEMFLPTAPNTKALHELIHYFLQERLAGNQEIKHLVITNLYDWYAFSAQDFERLFFQNRKLLDNYKKWQNGQLTDKTTDWLYKEIIKPFCETLTEEITITHCDIRHYEAQARAGESDRDLDLKDAFKFFSPTFMLKLSFGADANELNKPFYYELLHILGLMEVMEDGVPKIKRKKPKQRDEGSLLENVIMKLTESKSPSPLTPEGGMFTDSPLGLGAFDIDSPSGQGAFGASAFELVITWLNRILFLKLLEGQLLSYHDKNPQYAFLNLERVPDFEELDELFFRVFNTKVQERRDYISRKFPNLPYLNSGLFERTETETQFFTISCLKNRLTLPVYEHTVLKDTKGNPLSQQKNKVHKRTLEYLFEFLDAYDFGSEGKGLEIRQSSKTIMNAAVLGLVFEKINGYQDGSFFTPHFVTEYMCRDLVRKTIVQRFQTSTLPAYAKVVDFEDLQHAIGRGLRQPETLTQANDIINTMRICDPAVGSGHFLVGILNEIIWAKYELGVLKFRDGKRLASGAYELILENEEFRLIEYEIAKIITYNLHQIRFSHEHKVQHISQRYQETMFHEKQTIIENCLFGVDINANSVAICRLRLWIELLKNAYYTEESKFADLQTLPNLEINIKAGNSLISRFGLDTDLSAVFSKNKFSQKDYLLAVETYKQTTDTRAKQEIRKFIRDIKEQFKTTVFNADPRKKRLSLLKGQLTLVENKSQIGSLFEKLTEADITVDKRKLENEIEKLEKELHEKEEGKIYQNAFEWRFEFPEILDEHGNFVGFDIVVGNPPYIKEYEGKEKFAGLYELPLYQGKMDMWYFFVGLASQITKKDKMFGFIAPNNWTTNAGASKLREKVLNDLTIHALVDFGAFMVFDSASIQTMLMFFENKAGDNYSFDFRRLISQKPLFEYVKDLYAHKQTSEVLFLEPIVNKEILAGKFLTFVSDKTNQILTKLESKVNFHLNQKELTNGIHPHHAIVTKAMLDRLQNLFQVKTGIFVLTQAEIEALQIPDIEKTLLKPLYTSKELKKYAVVAEPKYHLIYTRSHFKNGTCLQHYPTLKAHLDRFQAVITSDNKPYGLHRSREERFFKGAKILSLRKCAVEPTFTYSEGDCYVQAEYFVIQTNRIHLKFLTALFNSKLIKYYLKNAGKMQGNNFQIDKEPLMKIPIYKPEDETPFIVLIDEILTHKKADSQADTSAQEREIDALVYALYDLSEAERAEVEAGF